MKPITIIATIVLASIVSLTGCKSKQQVATQQYPKWLQEKTTVLNERHCEITEWEYNGETFYGVFVKGPERSYDMNRTTIYDADGNVYMSLGGPRRRSEKEDTFFRNATNKGIIWQSEIAKSKQPAVLHKELQGNEE